MRIPDQLRLAIEEAVTGIAASDLKRASAEISATYRNEEFARPALRSAAHRSAYALVRMPATYAANVNALSNLRSTVPELFPHSVLDLGSGPGTSAWASQEVFPSIEKYTLMERDPELVSLGRSLSRLSPLGSVEWITSDIVSMNNLPKADLVLMSYALGELQSAVQIKLVELAWAAATQALVVIEPGTKRGFEVVIGVRTRLLELSAQLAAPCPHEEQCPMAAAGDWCHFAQRIERSSAHRRLKDGVVGHEDEKFSYVAASRLPVSPPIARVVRHPKIYSGFVKLDLCSGPALEQRTVTRSQRSIYKEARHLRWGDAWKH